MGTLGVSADSVPKVHRCSSGPEGTSDPGQPGLSASLINAVSGPARLDWSRRCVLLSRCLMIPWGILCGSLWVSGDSSGKAPRCWSDPEGTCHEIHFDVKKNMFRIKKLTFKRHSLAFFEALVESCFGK